MNLSVDEYAHHIQAMKVRAIKLNDLTVANAITLF